MNKYAIEVLTDIKRLVSKEQAIKLQQAIDILSSKVIAEGIVKLTGIGYVIKTKNKEWATAESMLKKYVNEEIIVSIKEISNGMEKT